MPQLDFSTFPNQIFWLVVTLVVIYLVLSKVALPRIASVLAERQGTITNDIAAAEELKRKAVEAEEAYDKALADARAEAEPHRRRGARPRFRTIWTWPYAKADAEIAAKSAESESDIDEIRASAVDSVRGRRQGYRRGDRRSAGRQGGCQGVTAAVTARLKG